MLDQSTCGGGVGCHLVLVPLGEFEVFSRIFALSAMVVGEGIECRETDAAGTVLSNIKLPFEASPPLLQLLLVLSAGDVALRNGFVEEYGQYQWRVRERADDTAVDRIAKEVGGGVQNSRDDREVGEAAGDRKQKRADEEERQKSAEVDGQIESQLYWKRHGDDRVEQWMLLVVLVMSSGRGGVCCMLCCRLGVQKEVEESVRKRNISIYASQ